MADMTQAKKWMVPLAIALVALLAGGLIGWSARSAEVAELQERLAEAEATPTVEPVAEEPEVPAALPDEPPAEEPESETPTTDATESGRQFCYVTNIETTAEDTFITVDYAQFLMGDEAAATAAARGDESPPPNDYYIVNDNPRLRTFPVQAGSMVQVHQGDPNLEAYTITLGQWQDRFIGMSPGMEVVRHVPYWITLEDGVVVAIEEQYLP